MKLLIVDDERFICETISNFIDWRKYQIDVLPPCYNGLDAYDVIVDELPEIVITDIRMPGIDGLELVKRTKEMGLETEFIVLSGFGEFEYAREAMQYGVKNYLLKPCNEEQIIEAVKQSMDSYSEMRQLRRLKDRRFASIGNMIHNTLSSMIDDILYHNKTYDEIARAYEPYIDLQGEPYRLTTIEHLDANSTTSFLGRLREHCAGRISHTSLFGVYMQQTFFLFTQDFTLKEGEIPDLVTAISQNPPPKATEESYPHLYALLATLLPKIKAADGVYYLGDFNLNYSCNYSTVSEQLSARYGRYQKGDEDAKEEILTLFHNLADLQYLKLLSSSFIHRITSGNPEASSLGIQEWLLDIDKEEDLDLLKEKVIKKVNQALDLHTQKSKLSDVVRQVCHLVHENIADPNITLKSITDNYLFMNVDYVSRKFRQEMDMKFSKYLTTTRIEKAKELLRHDPHMRIQDIAEKTGYYNNPHYFSKIFKKETGQTPSEFVVSLKEKAGNNH